MQAQSDKAERAIRHIRKKVRVVLQGLSPSKIVGRFNGPVVISNSIPKSGTHLIENVFELIPGLRNAGTRTLYVRAGQGRQHVLKAMERMKKGAFYNAHLPGYVDIMQKVKNENIKLVFLIRDPRDIVVSRYKYITYMDKLHPAHEAMISAESDADRLKLSIVGIDGLMRSIRGVLESFAPWILGADVLVCRFEDLIGEAGGGSALVQRESLEKIVSYLEYDHAALDLSRIQNLAFARKSSTYRKGKIGGWKDEFEAAHEDLFYKEAGDMLNIFGYN